MPGLSNPRYRGIFPVVPTTFGEDGALDLASQRRCVDFMIDSGVDGLCILANSRSSSWSRTRSGRS